METYKKWIVVSIFAAIAVIIFFAVKPGDFKKEVISAPSGPLMNTESKEPTAQLPDDPAELNSIGDRYFENNMYDKAIEAYEKALKLNPEDVDAYNDLGLAYHYTGKSDMAVTALKKGAEIMPSYQRIWLSLGFVLLSSDRNKEAKAALEKAVKLAPESDVAKEAERMLGLIK